MHITRRFALAGVTALTACGQGTTGQPTLAQVIADAQAIVTGLARALPIVAPLLKPALAAQFGQLVTVAQQLVASLSTNLPTSTVAATLAQIVDAVSAALAIVSGIPGLPPNVAILIAAASALLPVLAAFIGPLLPQQAPALAAKAARPAAVTMTPDQARATLKAAP